VNLSAPFIRRPVMTTILMAAILLFGLAAYRDLPVSDLPNVDFPTISVNANLPGASPETMASAVATPLERQFSTIAGIDSMNSVSTQGSTEITLQFTLDRDIDAAALDVQAAISRAVRRLPEDMPTPPSFRKVNPADQPILFLALTSATLPLSTLNAYGETMLAQRISMVDGVAQVQVFGSQKYAVRIQLDPARLAARGLGIDEVAQAVRAANVSLPTGVLQGRDRAFTIDADGELMEAAAYRSIVVGQQDGAAVRLEDLGRVIDDVENDKIAAWYCTPDSKRRAVVLAVQRQPGTNTVDVSMRVKALLPAFESLLPAAVELNVLFDRSLSIKESSDDVQFTLLLTLALVVFVIFLFLRRLTATLIPSLALPMSIVGTFLVMRPLGFSLDNLSLMALTLSVGFVVDDAIVMLENIVRHIEMGKSRRQAALDGAREIGFTIVSMTLSLAAVFLPVLFMGGIVGRLFREFAITIGVAVLVSGVVSLTLTPMLAALFLRTGGRAERHGPTRHGLSVRIYGLTLRFVLRHKFLTLLVTAAVLYTMVDLYGRVPKGFIPSEDRGQVNVSTEGAEGISFRALVEHQQEVAEIIRKNPGVMAFMSSAGARGGSSGNTGRCMIRLKDRSERSASADEVVQQLRASLAGVPGIRAYPQNPPTIQIGGMMSRSLYQYTLQGPDTGELRRSALALLARMREFPGFLDVTSDLMLANPEVRVTIDRDKAASLSVTPERIETALYTAYSSRQISTILAPDDQYAVLMELLPEHQADAASMDLLYVRSDTGRLVPLTALTRLAEGVGPMSVNHFGQLPAVTISFNLRPGVSIGQAVDTVNRAARELLPATITTSFQGTAQAFEKSLAGIGLLLAMAVLVIYMVLGVLYESFIHPITILTALPFAGFGALATLWWFDTELSLYAFVGIVMLIGLVKKNGIMMVDFAIAAQKGGKSPRDAIYEACLVRFRPIMMTTMAAIAGALPIAMGHGAGAEARRPLGLAVVGGLVFSQSLTLYVTPVFYLWMESFRGLFRRHPSSRPDLADTSEIDVREEAVAEAGRR
jgi:HAE1 family hydrophobic/amphiphilic exporter-1